MTIEWMDIKEDVVLVEYDGTKMVRSMEIKKKSRKEYESLEIEKYWR